MAAPARPRRLLLVYPAFPKTHYGMQYLYPLGRMRAFMPPLGLLTIAALTPSDVEIRLVDVNCEPLEDDDIAWADLVCFSAMLTQRRSLFALATRCRAQNKTIVFGGPYPTACPEQCRPYCDVLVLNEGEVTWPRFLADLERGTPQARYASEEKPDVTRVPVPRFDLVDLSHYTMVPLQFSRGCPFQCEFCDIIVMFGRRPRTKTAEQFCRELEAVRATGYRGLVFVVDDNFIGNEKEVRKLLPAMRAWNRAHGNPFLYCTEASVNLADDPSLVAEMVEASFRRVFIGIETPSMEALQQTRKFQNTKRPLERAVEAIQRGGLLVDAGFIVGFDSDGDDIFARQEEFITRAAIPNAIVSVLTALPGTPLYERMQRTGRLKAEKALDRDWCSATNIVTRMPERRLLEGHRELLVRLNAPDAYFARAIAQLCRLPRLGARAGLAELLGVGWLVVKTLVTQRRAGRRAAAGPSPAAALVRRLRTEVPPEFRRAAARFAWAVLRRRPYQLPRVAVFLFLGIHYYRFTFEDVIPELDRRLAELREPAASADAAVG